MWNYIKLFKKLFHSKRNNKMKRQPKRGKEIFANHISFKAPISKTYKEPIQLSRKKKKKSNKLIRKWAKDLNRHFVKKTYKWPTGT